MSLLQVTTLPFKFESYILINVAGAGVLYDFHYCTPRHDLGKVCTSRKIICLAKNYLPIFAFRLSTELTYQMRIILVSDKTSKFYKTRKTTFNHCQADISCQILQESYSGNRVVGACAAWWKFVFSLLFDSPNVQDSAFCLDIAWLLTFVTICKSACDQLEKREYFALCQISLQQTQVQFQFW